MFTKLVLPRHFLYAAVLLLAMLAACSKPVTPPPLPELPENLEAGWNRIAPEGETICADGSEYAFYVNPGTVNKLVVDFEGGGACWNDGTCSQPQNPGNDFQGIYFEGVYGSPEDYDLQGIFDRENEANPFRDWYHVHVSYCTADLHLGDNVATYTGPEGELTVNHKGAVNARSALKWVSDNFGAPETVFVTGISAGAYASIIRLPEIAERYPDADLYGLGDSGAGVVTEDFFSGDAGNWRIAGALPDLSEPITLDENILPNLYTAIGRDYPDAVLSQYNSLFDGTQIGFYGLMQGVFPPTPELSLEWSQKMTASLAAISAGTPNFRAYVSTLDVDNNPANGTSHTILNRPEFYTLETGGVSFVDWLGDLVSGREVENVSPSPSPGDAPASALGDSPTIRGTFVNIGRGDFSGKTLELKAGEFTSGPEDVYATSPITEGGAFSLRLPGAAEMAGRLVDGLPESFSLPGCDTTVTPETFKVAGVRFFFHVDGEITDEAIQASASDLNDPLVNYLYVDRDVRAVGSCTGGDYAGLETDIDLRRGWNTVVFDFDPLTYRNEDLSEGYAWFIPSLCNEDGECPAD